MDWLSDLRKRVGLPTWEEAQQGAEGLRSKVQTGLEGMVADHPANMGPPLPPGPTYGEIGAQFAEDMQGLRRKVMAPFQPPMPAAQPEARGGVSGQMVPRDPEEERSRLHSPIYGVRG